VAGFRSTTRKETAVLRTTLTALALALVTSLSGAAAAGQGATGPAQIPISGQQTSYTRVDVGKRLTSPGDMEIVRFRLFNRRLTSVAIGNAELVCTFTNARSRVCRGTYKLPRGKIIVGGSIQFRQVYELAVLGGTGLYDNARGTMTSTRIRRKPLREFLLFRLVG
jgi:hypothetical protein